MALKVDVWDTRNGLMTLLTEMLFYWLNVSCGFIPQWRCGPGEGTLTAICLDRWDIEEEIIWNHRSPNVLASPLFDLHGCQVWLVLHLSFVQHWGFQILFIAPGCLRNCHECFECFVALVASVVVAILVTYAVFRGAAAFEAGVVTDGGPVAAAAITGDVLVAAVSRWLVLWGVQLAFAPCPARKGDTWRCLSRWRNFTEWPASFELCLS